MRQDHKEIELKLVLSPADVGRLKAHRTFAELLGSPIRVERLNSVYFDTDQRDLQKNDVTLRVRREGQHFIQTIKLSSASLGAYERDEWEQPLADGQPDLDAIADTALGPILTREMRGALRPVFETRVERAYFQLADTAWRIEMALDQGEIVAGNRTSPICEIELELKHGYRAALFELARMIAEIIPAQLSLSSKSERGYALLNGRTHPAVHARPGALAPGISAASAFQTIARGCVRQLLANAPLLDPRNPDALHQMRIAGRRLRTAIALFSEIVRDSQVSRIRSELKWLNAELSPARDLDTLLSEVVNPLYEQHRDHKGLKSLRYSFARELVRSYKRADAAVHSQHYSKLMIDTFAWIEIGEWITATDEATRARRDGAAEDYAAEQLARRSKKLRKRGRKLETLDPSRRHKFRIQVKKTRYATEFFASLFRERKSTKRSGKFLSSLKHLQTSLGGLNDVTTRNALCDRILGKTRSGRGEERERAFAAGLIAGNQDARRADLLSEAAKAHAQLEDLKPFWK
jgi:triphosphatase